MKYSNKEVDLGERYGPYIKTSLRGEDTLVELSFYRTRSGPNTRHTTFHNVQFELSLDELACIGRTLILAAREARTKIIHNTDQAMDRLEGALNE